MENNNVVSTGQKFDFFNLYREDYKAEYVLVFS